MPDPARAVPAPRPDPVHGGVLGELGRIDRAVYRAIAATPSPRLDRGMTRLSAAADHSKLWLAIAGLLALRPGPPRRAALVAVASVGVASASVNLVVKPILRRSRPDQAAAAVPVGRTVRLPGSSSFPSGHSASAFAFATAAADDLPLTWLPLHGLAAAVAYSRVHTGVHYPADAVVGSLMGTGAAVAVRSTIRALRRPPAGSGAPDG
jgi:undecaprenyl-diphosphatase